MLRLLLVALAPLGLTAAEQVRIAIADPSSMFVSWVTPQESASSGSHCVQYKAISSDVDIPWSIAEARAHSYSTDTRGQWAGTVYTAILTHLQPYAKLIVYGDMGVGSHAEELVGELSSELRSGSAYDAILHLGDFCYNLPDPQARNWDIAEDWYIAHKQKSWDAWGRLVEPLASTVPYMTLPGNHETLPFDVQSFSPYLHRFPMPFAREPGQVVDTLEQLTIEQTPTTPVRLYYSINIGLAHVVMLNTESSSGSLELTETSEQYSWLINDLERVNKTVTPWILLCTHRPMYSSAAKQGSHLQLRRILEPVMEKFGVQIALSGHDHSYERTVGVLDGDPVPSGGVLHIRVGTAGLDHLSYWANGEQPAWSAYRELSYGYGRLTLTPVGGLTFQFVRTGERGIHMRGSHASRGVADTLTLSLHHTESVRDTQKDDNSARLNPPLHPSSYSLEALSLFLTISVLAYFTCMTVRKWSRWKTKRSLSPTPHTPATHPKWQL